MKWLFLGLAIGFGIWVFISAAINSLILVIAFGLLTISSAVLSAGIKE